MSTDEFIIDQYIRVDTIMHDVPKHPDAHLHPSELVTLGLLFVLKGVSTQLSAYGTLSPAPTLPVVRAWWTPYPWPTTS
jgi:hypothetical protein